MSFWLALLMNPQLLFAAAAVVVALLAFLAFGIISLTTNLFTALAVSLVPVGVLVLLVMRSRPLLGLGMIASGLFLVLLGSTGALPGLSVGEALAFGRSPP